MAELPSLIPIFPLPNVVLFPQVMLPLHIFEPRYRKMVRDTESQSPPLIGMALLRGNWQEQYEGNPEIFSIGCAGEMVRVAPLPDGRFNILLQGLRRYHIREEIFTAGYRQARVEWDPPLKEELDTGRRQGLRQLLDQYLKKNEQVQKFLSDPSIDDDFFVNFFAFHLDFLPIEKQSLLEVQPLVERADRLRDILDFKLTETGLPESHPGGAGKPRFH
jgi:Lon protease-like protein